MSGQHRTFETFEPKGEIAVVERPDRLIKLVFYPQGGQSMELVMEKQKAFDLAMDMLQHLYRLGEA
ncbi:hypothetical protein [Desulfobacca acetoxidans]|uniref:1D-myo-inosityl-2-acetamido-2-deoxy-alpha-D-glucopyranosidedeacetylase n=1 Tax=Desulfobacca acetoxidans (strain ATCC 700848 / DSM 11109 / ASRB2) TaxID=880072 RepID=F2NEX6_DESAR|nr:hypothetical protein [Desulfobacca acetoxidans]AEB08316.1 1D-myo-inosityl-2-acetamido-2-deoxy-alpha-D-glucopyranosidedeacetylase [Desulfobacca acetoxidans DSM 11109]HAY21892.1 hypothetical protein [Desulfobacterales bacterium]